MQANGTIQIGDQWVGKDHPTYIIAEIGINHNGDPGLARTLIEVAADAKASLLFGKRRENTRFISLAQKSGLGTNDFSKLLQKQVSI